ncbi:MAG: general secretion pathway protein GspK [Candidatus Omnitrophica bacterium]|nr:general secretion pathway protein GspK [Candidatus Omnitrophota bacterium]
MLFPLRRSSIIADRKGSILAVALWSLCLLTTFAVYLGSSVREKVWMVGRLDSRDRLRFVASAGVKRAILELRRKDESTVDTLRESWSNNRGAFQGKEVGEGIYSVSHVPSYMDSSFEQIRYGVVDEERKVNINTCKREVLENLLKSTAGMDQLDAESLSAAIVDWRDKDNVLSVALGSAEDQYYRALRNSYEAKDSDFEVPNEIFLVKGMTKDIFAKIKDYITIYSNGKININTASPKVLLALGLFRSVVDKILLFRCGDDSIEATADDYVFVSTKSIVSQLSKYVSLSESEVANLSNLVSAGYLETKSENFTITSTGRLKNRDASMKIICVFQRPSFQADPITGSLDTKGKIKYWQEKAD